MSNKKELTMSDFRAIIKEEAMKLKKRMVLEAEKKALKEEIGTLAGPTDKKNPNSIVEGMVKEGAEPMTLAEYEVHQEIFGMGKKAKEEKLRKRFIQMAAAWKKKGVIRGMTQEMLDALMATAAEDNYDGAPGWDKATQLMNYRPTKDIRYKGGIQGHTFGAGAEE